MLFLESHFAIKILSVQKLNWDFNDTYVQPRPYNAISFRLKGNSDFSDGRAVTHLNDGDILFMPQNVGYHLKSVEEEIIVIHFELEGKNQNNYEVIHPRHPESYRQLFESLLEEWNSRGQGYYLKAMSRFYAIFAKIQNHLSTADNAAYAKIKESVKYLHRNFTDSCLNIDALCNLSNMSDTYFRRLFYEVYGTTPIKFINELRINYAVELLETGYYTIEEIAEKCGFEDSKYFSTVFKKLKHQTPSSYNIK